jgi:hypothetical protein
MAESAKARGTGIAQRSPEYVANKMLEGKAVIALHKDGTWAGFCYIETWSHGDFVANSGLIVNPIYRKVGLAKAIKHKIFELSRQKYPDAKIFGLNYRSRRNEDQLGIGLRTGYLFGTDAGREFLERLHQLRKLRHPDSQRPQKLHVHRHVVRSCRKKETVRRKNEEDYA